MGDSDSEDSDGEGGLGNVSRVIIRPPGQSGKAKRGHLCFDAAFETGNLGKAELIGEFEYDLFLRPDTCNPRFRFWFNFTVDNVRQDQRVIFNIVNISKPRNLFNSGLTPLVKSTSRPKWQRLAKKNVFYYRSAMHQNHYVLSFTFSFDKEDDVYQFTLSQPYSYSRLQAYLNAIETKQLNANIIKNVMTKTLQNRNLDLLTIDNVSTKLRSVGLEKNYIRVIVILCRTHSGEAPASFVCQGLIEFLISNHPIAATLRNNFIFKIVPMVNPDGVFLGNNRCNLIGQDLNRTWNVATEFSHPTLVAIKNMLKELDDSDIYQLDFVIDIHAHSSLRGCFIYGNTYEDVYRYERHLVFPRLFATNTKDYVIDNSIFNADERKSGCARRYCCECLNDSINAYTLEISMGGCYLKDNKTVATYNEESYFQCGRNLARTFLQYYRFINIVPMSLVKSIRIKRRNRPRTHRIRSRSSTQYETNQRPKTTRSYAPISYTNLFISYDSGSSLEDLCTLPMRPLISRSRIPFVENQRINSRSLGNCSAKRANEHNYSRRTNPAQSQVNIATGDKNWYKTQDLPIDAPSKPYLSIIDLNQLTRSCLKKNNYFE